MSMAERDDTSSLREWLKAEHGAIEPLSIRQLVGGRSNVTYLVRDKSGGTVVVRRPPSGTHAGGAHDVLREARILTALENTAVPTPRVLAAVEASSGRPWPFYVMEYVPGPVVDSVDVLMNYSPDARQSMARELIDVLISLQSVDIDEVGLGDMRRARPYVERQLHRWKSQWERVAIRELPIIDRVASRIERLVPTLASAPDCLVHGDFRFGNVIVTPGDQPRVAAVLDWELANAGHPLNDLGYLGARLHAPAEVLADGRDPLSADGIDSFGQITEYYSSHGGADVSDLPLFVALSAWRWAIIIEGIAKRYAEGAMGGDTVDVAWQRNRVEVLARFAEEWLDM